VIVAVVGGNLQGVEATYLAHKAGWEVMVIDRKPVVPASSMCDRFVQIDITSEQDWGQVLRGADLVIPALEEDNALECLSRWTRSEGVPFAFNPAAYSISSSKIKSDQLFSKIGVPTPQPWPECGFPVMAKPSRSSGSKGVAIINSPEEMKGFDIPGNFTGSLVLQEFIQGPSYSLEVIGAHGYYTPIQITDLEMDATYDCKRVLAPTILSGDLCRIFEKLSVDIAHALNLQGIMDVEVILNNGELKVLEIDARLPSQTPTAVFWSTGLNLVKMLGELFMFPDRPFPQTKALRGVVYEHIKVSSGRIEVAGEHLMSGADPLHVQPDFFGADEAVTNFTEGRNNWVATLIISASDRSQAWEKRTTVIETIRKRFGLDDMCDSTPDGQEL
jgi:pyrrolysine biosynthesis protein PylC